MTPLARLPLLAAGFFSLLAGICAGLARLGWDLPPPVAGWAVLHGTLMASAFFGTVIGLERAVALEAAWAYLGPLGAAAGGLALAFGGYAAAVVLLAAGSTVFLAASLVVVKRQPRLHHATLAIGAAAWLAGNACLVAGMPAHAVTPAWIGFLVFTIAGERLELARVMPPSPAAKRIFAAIVLAMVPALALAAVVTAWQAAGACLLALSLWFAKNDVALRTIRARGLARYIAACLLAGYAWLAIASMIFLAGGDLPAGSLLHDAALHAVFLGFVFSMVFGHAPIIVPALFRVALPYHAVFYGPLVLLHATLAIRLAADLLAQGAARAAAGAGNAVAIALFAGTMLAAVLRGRKP